MFLYFFQEYFLLLWYFPVVLLKNIRAFRKSASSTEMSYTLAHWSVLFASNVNGKAESLESNAVLKVSSVW